MRVPMSSQMVKKLTIQCSNPDYQKMIQRSRVKKIFFNYIALVSDGMMLSTEFIQGTRANHLEKLRLQGIQYKPCQREIVLPTKLESGKSGNTYDFKAESHYLQIKLKHIVYIIALITVFSVTLQSIADTTPVLLTSANHLPISLFPIDAQIVDP